MTRPVAVGRQSFSGIIENNCFYVDKTFFIKDWWEDETDTTVILRPRRFGKTLTMSMVECFFSLKYAKRSDLFENLSIWQHEEYRELQGTYPVIFLTLAGIKEDNYIDAMAKFRYIIADLYSNFDYLLQSDKISNDEKEDFMHVRKRNSGVPLTDSIREISGLLYKHHGKKPIILLDEYDTPMLEAYVHGYWNEIVGFIKNLFNASFKTNPYTERILMTGITRVSKESIFSDFNHVKMITTLSTKYETAIGFTEEEVFAAMSEYGLEKKDEVKFWYDGFTFGRKSDIYNPWSIINYLSCGVIDTYWANSSGNAVIGELVAKSKKSFKEAMAVLLDGGSVESTIDENMVYADLGGDDKSAFSLMMASGYLTGERIGVEWEKRFNLRITNYETRIMFMRLINNWFTKEECYYNEFIQSLLDGNIEEMNAYMNQIALVTFSNFDVGKKPSLETPPEKFYHGFVLGLMVDLRDRYVITSNHQSGLGRYDVMLEPRDKAKDDAMIIEFKVHNAKKESSLEETVQMALQQIEDKKYEAVLIEKGIAKEKIRKYGFAFAGQNVLIGENSIQ